MSTIAHTSSKYRSHHSPEDMERFVCILVMEVMSSREIDMNSYTVVAKKKYHGSYQDGRVGFKGPSNYSYLGPAMNSQVLKACPCMPKAVYRDSS